MWRKILVPFSLNYYQTDKANSVDRSKNKNPRKLSNYLEFQQNRTVF